MVKNMELKIEAIK